MRNTREMSGHCVPAHETLGWLGLYKRRAHTLLIWTDNDALVVGTIRTTTASTKMLCGRWRESG